MSQKQVNDRHVEHKKDNCRDNEGTKRPLTSLLWGDVPSEMSELYSWKGQQAHKVKPTQSCYTQHQRQVQGLSWSLWAGLKTAALIPPTSRSRFCREVRGQLDVQILISWFICTDLINLKWCLWCALEMLFFRLLCLMNREKNAAKLTYAL